MFTVDMLVAVRLNGQHTSMAPQYGRVVEVFNQQRGIRVQVWHTPTFSQTVCCLASELTPVAELDW